MNVNNMINSVSPNPPIRNYSTFYTSKSSAIISVLTFHNVITGYYLSSVYSINPSVTWEYCNGQSETLVSLLPWSTRVLCLSVYTIGLEISGNTTVVGYTCRRAALRLGFNSWRLIRVITGISGPSYPPDHR